MEVILRGDPKEIAALVAEIQGQHRKELSLPKEMIKNVIHEGLRPQ